MVLWRTHDASRFSLSLSLSHPQRPCYTKHRTVIGAEQTANVGTGHRTALVSPVQSLMPLTLSRWRKSQYQTRHVHASCKCLTNFNDRSHQFGVAHSASLAAWRFDIILLLFIYLFFFFLPGGSVHSAALHPCLVTAQKKKSWWWGSFLALHADNDTSEKGVDNTAEYQIGDFFFFCFFSCAS